MTDSDVQFSTEARAPSGGSDARDLVRARIFAFITDLAWLIGVFALVTAFFPRGRWSFALHIVGPMLCYPALSYFFHRLGRATPSQKLIGLRSRTPDGGGARRLYDWLFLLRLEAFPQLRSLGTLVALAFGATAFALGGSTLLWMRDPTVRPYGARNVPLFAPNSSEGTQWNVLPYFYATGAFPTARNATIGGVEYAVPYERGPPHRFLGKIFIYWRTLNSKLVLTGPTTASQPSSPVELKDCSERWFGCLSARRGIWKASIQPHFGTDTIVESSWFEVDNAYLATEERARGIYVRALSGRGGVREGYFLVGPRMAIQGLILERSSGPEGQTASAALEKIVGSLRMTGELQAPRAFLNPKLASLRIGPKSAISELIDAEALLLSKVSIEPKNGDTFYHLAGMAITLYRHAKRENRIELAASSKAIVSNALRYLRDVDSKSPRTAEMERFDAEVEAR